MEIEKEILESIKESLTDNQWNYVKKSLTKVEIIRNQTQTNSKRYYEKLRKSKKHLCETCDRYFSTKQVLQKHEQSNLHKKRVNKNLS